MMIERPRHSVTLSSFRMQIHEVTGGEYRRLRPDSRPRDQLPQRSISWYEAYTYAAWLDGRLPTEAEWEYAARAGCPHTWCGPDGTAAAVEDVAWHRTHAVDVSGRLAAQRVMQLKPKPIGSANIRRSGPSILRSYQTDPR